MDIILLKDLEGFGSEGDIINVKPGFARNYLVPRG
ncbi:MAG TPA: 50S ribosomal protein L9, partial [Candidatus Marinimicrobia bacterium]|nr:50S ribosomal protein L9 [Candidatus Neomarinimicrobiota bacterium]